MIKLHLTKITKFIDLENLELYGNYVSLSLKKIISKHGRKLSAEMHLMFIKLTIIEN